MHWSSVFGWAGGVGAEVFGIVGEAEAGLLDGFEGESVELVRVRMQVAFKLLKGKKKSQEFLISRPFTAS
ncbi:hypothetical protein ANSO36C_08130 [Nostoc cf. commune SO-36]|uniref:Uncharacterized protein n=1 Tax=Nostoc cf. commune SO-36 TaxID=449208 RepID=A0ABN6PYB1_NOSCO|nr:hypothetical protein ANSO36C_08130 [Nostoc cf. commune SO-36]